MAKEAVGKLGKMNGSAVESWISEILHKHASENIWNLDEMGCFEGLFLTMGLTRRISR